MFDTDNRDRKRARSLLALGPEEGESRPAAGGGSLLSPSDDRHDDPVARHRLARSRREAAPSPFMAALARTSGSGPAQHAGTPWRDELDETETRETGENTVRGLRDRIRDRLFAGARSGPDGDVRAEAPSERLRATGDARADDRWQESPPSEEREAPRQADPAQDDEVWRPLIDPMTVIMSVVNSKSLIVATTIVGALLGVAIALSTPKKYEALTEILVDPRDLQLVERDLTGSNLPSDATLAIVENQARVLTSGTVLNEVVDKLNLTSDPEFNGRAGGGLGIGEIISNLRSLLSRRDAANDEGRVRAVTINHLADSLHVERGGKTFVISIGVETRDPDKSALIANTMTSVFLSAYGKIQANTAGRATDELTSRLDDLRAGVEAAERKVEDFKAQNDLVDAQGHLISDDEILKLNDQLSTARARTLELNAKAASSRNVGVNDAVNGTLPEELTSNVMIELRAQYAALQQQANKLAVQLGPRHPQRLAIEAQLVGARAQIANELRRIIASTQTELKRAVQLEQELSSRLAQLKVRQGDVNGDQVALRELEREASAKRAVYEAFLLRAKQTGEQKDINTANISVISKAYPPLDPVGPSRSLISIVGMALGMFAGVGIGAARGAVWSLRQRAVEGRADRSAPRPSGPRAPQPPQPSGAGPGRLASRTRKNTTLDKDGASERDAGMRDWDPAPLRQPARPAERPERARPPEPEDVAPVRSAPGPLGYRGFDVRWTDQPDMDDRQRVRAPSRWLTAFRKITGTQPKGDEHWGDAPATGWPAQSRPSWPQPAQSAWPQAPVNAPPAFGPAAPPPPAWNPQPPAAGFAPAFTPPPAPPFGYQAPLPPHSAAPQPPQPPVAAPEPPFQPMPQPAMGAAFQSLPYGAFAPRPASYGGMQLPSQGGAPAQPVMQPASAHGRRDAGTRDDPPDPETPPRRKARPSSRETDRIESIDDIRDSLREFREAVDDLSRSRMRRNS